MKTEQERTKARIETLEAETTRLRAEVDALDAYCVRLEDERDEAIKELVSVRRILDEYRVAHIHSLETTKEADVNEDANVGGGD